MKVCGFETGIDQPIFLIAGPCVAESRELLVDTARTLRDMADRLGLSLIFKASFDKANRSSSESYRGPGMIQALEWLREVREETGLPVLTDVHTPEQVEQVVDYVDMLQTPAFLCRQTDLIEAVSACGKPVNIKKGQFLAPGDMQQVVNKGFAAGGEGRITVCERGVSFGYNNLVVDMRSLAIMRATGCPVVFDATHAVQLPGGQGDRSGGQREHVPVLARAAVAAGVSGLFMETHPDPEKALSDGPNAWPLGRMEELLETLLELDRVVKSRPLAEQQLPSAD
ncbi:MAG: 3-deoxy-8-phosphooctulonate synthase [Immundisolibacteraceae bacterium]|nr:3-deoxy-8-phosphooctulonate synthase [Immundisolibacteraceae bacterium]